MNHRSQHCSLLLPVVTQTNQHETSITSTAHEADALVSFNRNLDSDSGIGIQQCCPPRRRPNPTTKLHNLSSPVCLFKRKRLIRISTTVSVFCILFSSTATTITTIFQTESYPCPRAQDDPRALVTR